MLAVLLDKDPTYCEPLSYELKSLGLATQVLTMDTDWYAEIDSESQVVLICMSGLGNRLAAMRRMAEIGAMTDMVLIAKDTGTSFANLCFQLGARAVLSRHESPEDLAPMIARLADASLGVPSLKGVS